MNVQYVESKLKCDTKRYIISTDIESDQGYNSLLGRYVMAALKNDFNETLDGDSLSILYSRSSFLKTIMFLCDSTNYVTSNIVYEDINRYEENLPNLLSYCNDEKIKYSIADSLLERNSQIGLLAMWETCDISKLKKYTEYRNYLINNKKIYLLGDLAIISHNIGNSEETKLIINFVKKYNNKFYYFLKKYLKKKHSISYYDYISDFYDYWENAID